MVLTTDIQAFTRLDKALSGTIKTVSDRVVAGKAMRLALAPMLAKAKSEAPQKTGATSRDTRIKVVSGKDGEVVRGLVGVSKRKGKRGRITHLITRVNRNRSSADDFLTRAEAQTIGQVEASYAGFVESTITDQINRL